MKKLNFGSGSRISSGWINIDFHSTNPEVLRVNLLRGFPFKDDSLDVVYSSHVLEHFTPSQGRYLIKESYRVLNKGGIIRVVVPDLEGSMKEYFRILQMDDQSPDKRLCHEWIMAEILDQLVRMRRPTEMGEVRRKIFQSHDKKMIEYFKSRTESLIDSDNNKLNKGMRVSLVNKVRKVSWDRISTRLVYSYLKFIGALIPGSIRPLVFIETSIGERHQWMYDQYSMKNLLEDTGFRNVRVVSYNESDIPNFNDDFLDINHDGTSYKNNSLYVEATK